MCISVLFCLHLSLHAVYTAAVMEFWWLWELCWCWELDSGPLWDQPVFLTAEPSSSPRYCLVLLLLFCSICPKPVSFHEGTVFKKESKLGLSAPPGVFIWRYYTCETAVPIWSIWLPVKCRRSAQLHWWSQRLNVNQRHVFFPYCPDSSAEGGELGDWSLSFSLPHFSRHRKLNNSKLKV